MKKDIEAMLITGVPGASVVAVANTESIIVETIVVFLIAGTIGVIIRRFLSLLVKEDRLKNKVPLDK